MIIIMTLVYVIVKNEVGISSFYYLKIRSSWYVITVIWGLLSFKKNIWTYPIHPSLSFTSVKFCNSEQWWLNYVEKQINNSIITTNLIYNQSKHYIALVQWYDKRGKWHNFDAEKVDVVCRKKRYSYL